MPPQLECVSADRDKREQIDLAPRYHHVPVTPTNSVPKYAKTAVVKVDHTARNLPALPARTSISIVRPDL
jgi:hypothetical protein